MLVLVLMLRLGSWSLLRHPRHRRGPHFGLRSRRGGTVAHAAAAASPARFVGSIPSSRPCTLIWKLNVVLTDMVILYAQGGCTFDTDKVHISD